MIISKEYAEQLMSTQGWQTLEKEINAIIDGLSSSLVNKTPESLIDVCSKQATIKAYRNILFMVNGK